MPNHITNKMTVIKGDFELSQITTFNTVVPMPQALREIAHDGIATEVEYMLGVTKSFFGDRPTLPEIQEKYPELKDKDAIHKAMANQVMYGATTWYRWSINNWGTKWDMYEVGCKNNVLQFDTAWSTPMLWAEHFAKTLPDGVVIKLEYADEDIGSNAGSIELSNKGCVGKHFDNNSDEAWQLAIKLKNMGDECHKINGEWVWVGEEE